LQFVSIVSVPKNECKKRQQKLKFAASAAVTVKLAFPMKRQRLKHAHAGRAESVLFKARQCLLWT
jgi:hypothetical protein